MTKYYKVQYIELADEWGRVTTTTTTEDGLDNLLNSEFVDLIHYEETQEPKYECN